MPLFPSGALSLGPPSSVRSVGLFSLRICKPPGFRGASYPPSVDASPCLPLRPQGFVPSLFFCQHPEAHSVACPSLRRVCCRPHELRVLSSGWVKVFFRAGIGGDRCRWLQRTFIFCCFCHQNKRMGISLYPHASPLLSVGMNCFLYSAV